MRRGLAVCALAAGLLAALPAASRTAPACPVGRAVYAMAGRPDVTAGFRFVSKREGWLSEWALYVASAKTGRRYWFLFDEGSAQYVNLISTEDVTKPGWSPPPSDGGPRPLGEMHYLASDDGLSYSLDLPDQRRAAPRFILLPDLSEVLWSRAQPREAVPVAVFKQTGCKAAG
ncbi:MAG TPA: hypothetical protein VFE18_00445 [Phenylobacterium sp.]|jgi:hypothetical protein|uniref:hypothetical protein n=1 Tax=Phenylobacterium sp. TaxID=1871053 RepID=UPI002D619298|nr:hypothetical protein [Phenylobacterium sp.]HZZ66617.1 hypothetical protein [Phenylobacterium sp.]